MPISDELLPAFHPLPQSDIPSPERFTFPFCYEPHPLCLQAAAELQGYIVSVECWRRDIAGGKMFGVLVVAGPGGRRGYLAAYSGLLAGRNDWPHFVPAVYDMLEPGGYFKTREDEITAVNRSIRALETDSGRLAAIARAAAVRREGEEAVARYKEVMAEAKRRRDERRAAGCGEGPLTAESQFQKAELRRIRKRHAALADEARLAELRGRRRRMSDSLQKWLFGQFVMLNALGVRRDLTDIFAAETGALPPSGAGECCAPKLLQYAYAHGLRPLCMAEFWWGASPATELRRHLHYYPACRGKCKPILAHMLIGLDIDPDPLAGDDGGRLETVYEDDALAVVLKPAGMLSVPGRSDRRSVESLMRLRCPGAGGPLMVHRLDMATSGLLVVAKTARVHKLLQAQFAERSVVKRYVALLAASRPIPPEGRISLPLRPDPLDRPRQVADPAGGRPAVTLFRRLAVESRGVRVALQPLTGRTHQLRVHCAHPSGLGAPIVGDTLYGLRAERLFLHAERLEFTHPDTGCRMRFVREADF